MCVFCPVIRIFNKLFKSFNDRNEEKFGFIFGKLDAVAADFTIFSNLIFFYTFGVKRR